MSNENKSLSIQLEELINSVSDNCGPLLIKELQIRINQTVERFNADMNGLLIDSFKAYKDRIKFCKKIISDKQLIENSQPSIMNESKSITPEFIKKHEQENKK